MTVTIRLFAMLRERVGTGELLLEMPDDATVEMANAKLLQKYPALSEWLAKTAVAVNRVYAGRQTVLKDGDELALIPPVSGG